MNAAIRFDGDSGHSFLAFSKKHIRGAMMDEIRSMDWIGRTYRSKDIDLPSMRAFSCYADEDTGNTINPLDFGVSAERKAEAAEMVKWFLDRLPERYARIIWAYHGPEELTYQQIATELGISESRVANLYHRAVEKMLYWADKLGYDPCE